MAESMTGITGEMSPAQAQIFAIVPPDWAAIPRIGVHDMIVRALSNRGVVETRWENGAKQWRRVPRVELVDGALICRRLPRNGR